MQFACKKLNGTIAYTVKSFCYIIWKRTVIACPECLDNENNNSITTMLLLGWWGAVGLLKTPIYIYRNIKLKVKIISKDQTKLYYHLH
jgi:hypothetical protein